MFQRIDKRIGVSKFRTAMPRYLRYAKEKPLVIAGRRGDEPYVVMSAEMYNKLVEAREDTIDAETLARLVKENSGRKKISWKKRN